MAVRVVLSSTTSTVPFILDDVGAALVENAGVPLELEPEMLLLLVLELELVDVLVDVKESLVVLNAGVEAVKVWKRVGLEVGA